MRRDSMRKRRCSISQPLEGRRRVLGAEHKDTLATLNNMGVLFHQVEDYEGALDYYRRALRGKEKVFGKTHPNTLSTIMNMGTVYREGLKDFTKAEEVSRLALEGYDKSLGKEHEEMRKCAFNFAVLIVQELKDKAKMRAHVKVFPDLLGENEYPQGPQLADDIRMLLA